MMDLPGPPGEETSAGEAIGVDLEGDGGGGEGGVHGGSWDGGGRAGYEATAEAFRAHREVAPTYAPTCLTNVRGTPYVR
jgi:hypothetical protein